MTNNLLYSDLDEWGSTDDDELLFESEELSKQYIIDDKDPEVNIMDDDLPLLPLRGLVVYPMSWFPLPVGQERSIRLVEDSLPANRMIVLVASKDENID